jgi:hypothetical protein
MAGREDREALPHRPCGLKQSHEDGLKTDLGDNPRRLKKFFRYGQASG